ncbi:MAG: hypothetical protein KGK34_11080 [Chloroflexota bacterium]|nr:hypothetical protein [Chloroflexota bacterium]
MSGTDRPAAIEARGLELVGHSDLDGRGDGMQVMRNGDVVYVGHMGDDGVGTSVVDVSDPRQPRVVRQLPAPVPARSHKVQYADGLLLVNHEIFPPRDVTAETGLAVYDVSRPAEPRRLGFLPLRGLGVHRMWWTGGRYAYAAARSLPGIHGGAVVTIDLSDPERPRLHAEWHLPEQERAGRNPGIRAPGRYASCHHPIVAGDRLYAGWSDAGVLTFALDDGKLSLLGRVEWTDRVGGHPYTHTALPLGERGLLVATDEAIDPDLMGARKDIHMIDLSDERAPREIALFPVPDGHRDVRGLRFGPHNLHENRPGTFRSDTVVYATYFSAGLRVYDTSDPTAPREVASFVPAAPPGQACIQLNDLLVDADRTIFVTDRHHGGLYILRHTT